MSVKLNESEIRGIDFAVRVTAKSFPFIKDNSQDLVYSFDSFVHMHLNVIDDYLKEIYRVLTPGGKGIIHHSNLWGGSENSFENNAGRSNMTPFFFGELIKKHNMKIVEQKEIKMTPNIGEHDYQTKFKRIKEFLTDGHRVSVIIQLKGRERGTPEKAKEFVQKIEADLGEIASVVVPASFGGNAAAITFGPKKK
jgi:ubiquinone/menaquinone biosynthesis C-methylase UbiE